MTAEDEILKSKTDVEQKLTIRQKLSKHKTTLRNRNGFVDLLIILFAIESWIGIQSVFLQIPLLVDTAPENWRLPSFVTIAIQFGNIGPIIYTLFQKNFKNQISDSSFIYAVKIIGVISSLLMAFFYQNIVTIGENQYSLALLILVFFLALGACSSSVLFMPYMGRFKDIYLVTYLIGESISGLVASILALFQGIGDDSGDGIRAECKPANGTEDLQNIQSNKTLPNFSTFIFFILIFFIVVCSLIAFILLEHLPICKNEYDKNVKIGYGNSYEYTSTLQETNNEQYTFKNILILLAVISFIGNGILPSIQSFSCMPFGNHIYHLTVSLTLIANPASYLLIVFLPHSSIRLIIYLTGGFILTTSYIFVTALMSPKPFLNESNFGGIIIVLIWTIHTGIFSYIKLCITTLMRSYGGNSLVWTGGIAQAGTVIGTVSIFVIVNYFQIFQGTLEHC